MKRKKKISRVRLDELSEAYYLITIALIAGCVGRKCFNLLTPHYRITMTKLKNKDTEYMLKTKDGWKSAGVSGSSLFREYGEGKLKRDELNPEVAEKVCAGMPGYNFYKKQFASTKLSGQIQRVIRRIEMSRWITVCMTSGVLFNPEEMERLYPLDEDDGEDWEHIVDGDVFPKTMTDPSFYESLVYKKSGRLSMVKTNHSRNIGILVNERYGYMCYPSILRGTDWSYGGEYVAEQFIYHKFMSRNFAYGSGERKKAIVLGGRGYLPEYEGVFWRDTNKKTPFANLFDDVYVIETSEDAATDLLLIIDEDAFLKRRREEYAPHSTDSHGHCYDKSTETTYVFFETGNVKLLKETIWFVEDELKRSKDITPSLTITCNARQYEFLYGVTENLREAGEETVRLIVTD